MPKLLRPVLLQLLTLSAVLQFYAISTAKPPIGSVLQAGIPEATEPCTDEEAKWWQELRTAGSELAAASRRKDQAELDAASRAYRQGRVPGNSEDRLSRKERDKLDAEIESARQDYTRVVRAAQEKFYRVPIRDSDRAILLYLGSPYYTETARRKKTMGQVRLRVEFRADGLIGIVEVLHGIGDGLDEQAVSAVRRIVFLPVTRNKVFVTVSKSIEVDFNLK